MEIIFNTSYYVGRTIKRPRICTDREAQCRYIELVADIVRESDSTSPVIISPAMFDFAKLDSLDIREIDFEITNTSDSIIEPSLIAWPQDYIYLTLPQKIDGGSIGQGRAWLNGNILDADFEKSFTIECNDENRSRFTIPIIRRIQKVATTMPSIDIEPNCPE